MKTFEQHLHDSGTGGYPLRTILDNLTDEEIEDSVREFAREYAQKACEDLRERIAENVKMKLRDNCLDLTMHDEWQEIDKSSILNTEIILP